MMASALPLITCPVSVWRTCGAAWNSCIRGIMRSTSRHAHRAARAPASICRGANMAETRVLIVEDEPPARAKLARLLAAHDGYRVIAEADSISAGLTALRDGKPDLLFLDINLGVGNGFDLLTRAT